jgi:hypothetical protein
MDHDRTSIATQSQPYKIPVLVWVLGAGLGLTLVAAFVFNVSWSTVGYYAFFAFFIGGHFLMHAGHGAHGSHGQHNNLSTNQSLADPTQSKDDEHAGHSSGCH